MWKTGDQEMATPKRVRTYRPKYSNTSLSRELRINMANKKNKKTIVASGVAPPLARHTNIGGYTRVASYDVPGKQLHNCNPVK